MTIKLSTGQASTLGNYRALTATVFGEESQAVAFLDDQILKSPHGPDEEVIAGERQMIGLIYGIHSAPAMPEPEAICRAAVVAARR